MQPPILIKQNISLKHLNSFGINTTTRYFATVQTVSDLQNVLSQPLLQDIPRIILGGGSNILFTKDFDGVVIKNEIKGIRHLSEDNDHVWIEVGSGENWHDFVIYCVQQGYGGIENLSLIPGTVGAAPIQNIGAYGVELCDTLIQLNALDLETGATRIFTNEECQFGYRDSVFKQRYKNKFAILSITLKLDKKPKLHLEYGEIKKSMESLHFKELNLKSISDTIIYIRRNKLPDPNQLGNAGSFFKNPIISSSLFTEIQKSYPQVPHFPATTSDATKVPAGWLIEQCGWKGKRFGEVGVYEKQALILVNFGAGKGHEIKELAEKIQSSVMDKFGIQLTPEVNII